MIETSQEIGNYCNWTIVPKNVSSKMSLVRKQKNSSSSFCFCLFFYHKLEIHTMSDAYSDTSIGYDIPKDPPST